MKILICGPDGSGKSTLADTLSHRLALPIFKGSVNDKDKQYNLETLLFERDNFICDRCYALEDEVYTNLGIGEKTIELTPNIIDQIKNNCIIIYLNADNNILYERLSSRGDKYISISESFLNNLKLEYEKFFNKYQFTPLVFNNATTESIVKEVVSMLTKK